MQDLEKEIGDLAEVYSFHGFARRLLHSNDVICITRDVHYFPPMDLLYHQDVSLLRGHTTWAKITDALMNLHQDSPIWEGVLRSGSYYDAVGHTYSVRRILVFLQSEPNVGPTFVIKRLPHPALKSHALE